MGKLNEILKKIKGMFNRNKALPTGATEQIITDTAPENYEKEEKIEMETSKHQDFVNELQMQAEQFDLTRMKPDEAILKVLEEEGLNPELSKNPEFKEQMWNIFKLELMANDQTAETKIKNLRSAIRGRGLKDYHFSITANGEFEYTKDNDKSFTNPSIKKYFMLDEKGNLITTELSHIDYDHFDEFQNVTAHYTSFDKRQEIFNKDGLQTDYIAGSLTQNMSDSLHSTVSSHISTVKRSSDLVTALQYEYDSPSRLGTDWYKNTSSYFEVENDVKFSPNYKYKNKFRNFVLHEACAENPMHLRYMTFSMDELKNLYTDEVLERNSDKNGTVNYEKLKSEYRCIPEAVTPDEKAYLQNYKDILLKDAIKDSPAFKKIAEERGLVAKEDVAMEQE